MIHISDEEVPDDVLDQLLADDGKSVSDLIKEKAQENRYQGQARDIAYINAMNEILEPRMALYDLLNSLVNSHVSAC